MVSLPRNGIYPHHHTTIPSLAGPTVMRMYVDRELMKDSIYTVATHKAVPVARVASISEDAALRVQGYVHHSLYT